MFVRQPRLQFSRDHYVLIANLFLLQSVFVCQVFPPVPGIVNTVKTCLQKKDSLRTMPMLKLLGGLLELMPSSR